jgi:2-polyprenyl-3-methyl-5-hydroxy-6-metoxy-1,4-benzoquinol methylase
LTAEPETDRRQRREAAFFDQVTARTPDQQLEEELLAAEGDGNLRTMIEWLGGLRGRRVLDVCCGTGTTSILLARRGAEVVGCDVSAVSVAAAGERAARLGLQDRTSFVPQDLEERREEWSGRFDALFGSYALHHLDLERCLPLLAGYLRPGARSAFLETSAMNPLLHGARRWLAGRFGVPRYGTEDEHPLTEDDVRLTGRHLGGCRVLVGNYAFLAILDRQVFRYRSSLLSTACTAGDAVLRRLYPSGSYHVVLACGPFPAQT